MCEWFYGIHLIDLDFDWTRRERYQFLSYRQMVVNWMQLIQSMMLCLLNWSMQSLAFSTYNCITVSTSHWIVVLLIWFDISQVCFVLSRANCNPFVLILTHDWFVLVLTSATFICNQLTAINRADFGNWMMVVKQQQTFTFLSKGRGDFELGISTLLTKRIESTNFNVTKIVVSIKKFLTYTCTL